MGPIIFVAFVLNSLGDAKSDCEMALAEAKKVGLPVSIADLTWPMPTGDSKKIESILSLAHKEMTKNEEPLEATVKRDFENIKRKKQGKKEIPYPVESEAQRNKREANVLRILDGLKSTKGPYVKSFSGDAGDNFVQGATIKGFVKLEIAKAESAQIAGNSSDSIGRLKVARRLVELSSNEGTIVSVLMQSASAQIYFASIEKLARSNPNFKKSLTADMLAPFNRPTNKRILQVEFLSSLNLFMGKDGKLPADLQSLQFVMQNTHAWITAFEAMKDTTTGVELQNVYKVIQPKMGSFKGKDDNDGFPYGPAWAEDAGKLDKAENKRIEVVKSLGL